MFAEILADVFSRESSKKDETALTFDRSNEVVEVVSSAIGNNVIAVGLILEVSQFLFARLVEENLRLGFIKLMLQVINAVAGWILVSDPEAVDVFLLNHRV